MAIVKPFRGIRPPQEWVEQVVSRPYDVLNSEEARQEAAGNEKSLYHIIKPEIDFRRVLTSTIPVSMIRRSRISRRSRIKAGWYRTTRNVITSMRRP